MELTLGENHLDKERVAASDDKTVLVAGANGKLGSRICQSLLHRGAKVRALVREGGNTVIPGVVTQAGFSIVLVNYGDAAELKKACEGVTCVVSALSGLDEVIVGIQKQLLKAAIAAGVPRYIPSDYCIDYTKLSKGTNRNLDLRREFGEQLDNANIAGTSILNGMFSDLLCGEAPVIQKGIKRVLYWGDAEQKMDFTSMDDTADFTAAAALDDRAPRYLRIAGEVASARDLQKIASHAFGVRYGLLRPGNLGMLRALIKITRSLAPQKKEVFPVWQGMQYLHDMLSGLVKLEPLDNWRYAVKWTSIKDVLQRKDF